MTRTLLVSLFCAAAFSGAAFAKVTPEEAAQLGRGRVKTQKYGPAVSQPMILGG